MKKLITSQLLLLVMVSFFIISCSKKDDEVVEPIVPNPEGFFMTGTNTVASALTDATARLPLAVLEASIKNAKGEDRDSFNTKTDIFGKYAYIGAGSTIKFTNVVAGVTKVYGAPGGGTVSNLFATGPATIDDNVISGTLTEGAPDIAVAEEGYYYIYVDLTTLYFTVAKIKPNVIGDATTGDGTGWDAGKALTVKSITKDEVVYEGKQVAMYNAHGYRYRIFNGWQAYNADGTITLTNLGVQDYGKAWDAKKTELGYLRQNIPFFEDNGYYTITLKYTASTGKWTDTKVKTGELPVDYSNYSMQIIGDATAEGAWNGDGTGGYGATKPTKSGDVYTWTWSNVSLLETKEFIFLQDATWGKLQLDYAAATVSGTAITSGDILDATIAPTPSKDHNYHVITGGSYDITLVINGSTNVKTVTVNNH